jgi:hypothetical protein
MALGVVLTPYGKIPGGYPPSGIAYQYGGNGTYLGPPDPQFYTQGEAGYYFDSPLGAARAPNFFERMRIKRALKKIGLGAIPTDFELATVRNYLPVESGWVTTKQGYQTGPWLPPHGVWPPYTRAPIPGIPGYAPPSNLGAVPADSDNPVVMQPATTDDVVALMNAHNDRLFALTIVSTTAVAVSALLTVFRTLKLIKEDR